MQSVELSKSDAKVLSAVFDPESGPASVEILIDPSLPSDRHIQDANLLYDLKIREREAIKLIEWFEKSPNTHDPQIKDDTYRSALEILDEIIKQYPNYASARNNRAQLWRWRYGDRNTLVQRRAVRDAARQGCGVAAVQDLQTCIAVASPGRPTDAVSPVQGRLLAQACTQLGALYYAAAKDIDDATDSIDVDVANDFAGWSKERFEEEASRLFYRGGLYGNEVAKALAVHANPAAKLCGSIVRDAMRREIGDVGVH